MRSLVNVVQFKGFWLAAVWGAAQGVLWAGPVALLVLLVAHLRLVPAGEREAELRYVLAVGLIGAVLDTGLHAIGATTYPTSAAAWPHLLVPPWIVALWVGFATLPRFSLHWLAGRPWLAVLFGAIGGPLSFLGGTRFGSVAIGDSTWLTLGALSLEYALVMPLLMALAPASRSRQSGAEVEEEPQPVLAADEGSASSVPH